jgi:AAA family ATP:ADP antiporter
MNSYKELHHQLPRNVRLSLLWILVSYFMVLFTYPIMRSTTGAIFLEVFSADDLPLMWLTSVLSLSVTVPLLSQLQKKFSVPILFIATNIFTIILMIIGLNLFEAGFKNAAFLMAVIKEVYIVVLIHQILGFCNANLNFDQVKLLYGPITAAGGVGGIVGGQLTSYLVSGFGTNALLQAAIVSLIFSAITFFFGRKLAELDVVEAKSEEKKISPLASIKGIGKYVFFNRCSDFAHAIHHQHC